MRHPELQTQLQQLCATLQRFQFGIGGSCLLWQLGLEVSPNDIDMVCTEADFPAICDALKADGFTAQNTAPHPQYMSAHFCRFSRADWPDIELMAGIAVKQHFAGQLFQLLHRPRHCLWRECQLHCTGFKITQFRRTAEDPQQFEFIQRHRDYSCLWNSESLTIPF